MGHYRSEMMSQSEIDAEEAYSVLSRNCKAIHRSLLPLSSAQFSVDDLRFIVKTPAIDRYGAPAWSKKDLARLNDLKKRYL